MSRRSGAALGLALLVVLVVLLFHRALFLGEIPSYRDAGHFYYPLYQKVQQEWSAGRLPLWDPGENAGMPLLGNPTAAVLYPFKLLYWERLWPYAWGARAYTIFHVVLAALTMYSLARTLGTSPVGSWLSAFGYAFSGPVLFQYCNVIYLVGAAWAPLGLRGADRWLRQGKPWGLAELAAALALQALGGDPEIAYLVGVASAAYAVFLALPATAWPRSIAKPARIGLALAAVWIALAFLAAYYLPDLLWRAQPDRPRPDEVSVVVSNPITNEPTRILAVHLLHLVGLAIAGVAWVVAAVAIGRLAGLDGRRRLVKGLAGLIVAGGVGIALTGAQLLPVLEFTELSLRSAAEAPHDPYEFSLVPFRVPELFWPGVLGSMMPVNHDLVPLLPPKNPAKPWVASLYMGGLPIVLGLSAFGFRGGPPGRAWMSGMVLAAAVGSLGEYASPLWLARFHPRVEAAIGPHDPADAESLRFDRKILDGDGSPYWLVTRLLPGFGSFRFPAKLWTLGCLGLAALAGFGWDRRRGLVLAIAMLAVSLAAIGLLVAMGPRLLAWIQSQTDRLPGVFGPIDAAGALGEMRRGLVHGAVVFGIAAVLVRLARRKPGLAGALAMVLTAADLAPPGLRMIHTSPRSDLEAVPEVLAAIEAAEAREPSAGPYRIHRMELWYPPGWGEAASPDRFRELVQWEHGTMQPKHGLPFGVAYTKTVGTSELYDYCFFFAPFERTVRESPMTASLGLREGDRLVYFPRKGFDLWNTRYFVVPMNPSGWKDISRGFASFLMDSTLIAPPEFTGPDREKDAIAWVHDHDWQVLRNNQEFPRAWVVHDFKAVPPIVGKGRADRETRMVAMLHQADAFWNDPALPTLNLRQLAVVEEADRDALAAVLDRQPPGPDESVSVVENGPTRVVIDARLDRPGLVVLADVVYPGWKLEIDGQPSPILRANHLQRGALVGAGSHRLVYTYVRPESFRKGLTASAAGGLGLLLLLIWGLFTPRPTDQDIPNEEGQAS